VFFETHILNIGTRVLVKLVASFMAAKYSKIVLIYYWPTYT